MTAPTALTVIALAFIVGLSLTACGTEPPASTMSESSLVGANVESVLLAKRAEFTVVFRASSGSPDHHGIAVWRQSNELVRFDQFPTDAAQPRGGSFTYRDERLKVREGDLDIAGCEWSASTANAEVSCSAGGSPMDSFFWGLLGGTVVAADDRVLEGVDLTCYSVQAGARYSGEICAGRASGVPTSMVVEDLRFGGTRSFEAVAGSIGTDQFVPALVFVRSDGGPRRLEATIPKTELLLPALN